MTTEFDEREWEKERADFVADVVADRVEVGPLVTQFTALTGALLTARTVAGVLKQVAEAALSLLPGADFVSVTLRSPDGSFHTPVQTDSLAVTT